MHEPRCWSSAAVGFSLSRKIYARVGLRHIVEALGDKYRFCIYSCWNGKTGFFTLTEMTGVSFKNFPWRASFNSWGSLHESAEIQCPRLDSEICSLHEHWTLILFELSLSSALEGWILLPLFCPVVLMNKTSRRGSCWRASNVGTVFPPTAGHDILLYLLYAEPWTVWTTTDPLFHVMIETHHSG